MAPTPKAAATRQRILDAAREEFLAKGYHGASLRTIAHRAGVTTGALYGAFLDKDALFDAVVGAPVRWFVSRFEAAQREFWGLDDEVQVAQMHSFSQAALFELVDHLFAHRDEFVIVVTGSAGSPFERWLDPVIALEEASTRRFIQTARRAGFPVQDIDDVLIHSLCSSFFRGILEPLIHGMDKAAAVAHIHQLRAYAVAGWDVLLGIVPPR